MAQLSGGGQSKGVTYVRNLQRSWLWLIIVTLVMGLGAFSACNDDDDGESGGDGGGGLAADQTLRIRLIGEPTSLDPQIAAFSSDVGVVKQLFRGLFYYGSTELDIAPAAATELPTTDNGGISADGLTYTIRLRDDLTWSDGEPLTAEDFEFSLKRLFDPNAGGSGYYYAYYTDIVGGQEAVDGGSLDDVGVTAIDATTLEIKLVQPRPTLLTLLALWPASPVREDVVSESEAWTEAGSLIGNGPYVLSEWAHDDHITLTANENYWGDDEPTVQTIVYQMQPNEATALISYENGELDMTPIPLTDAERFDGDPEQLQYAQLATIGMQFNVTREPFDNADVRKAFTTAIDRDTFVNDVRGGVGQATTSWMPPGVPGYDAMRGAEYAFDAAQAKQFLSDAGFPDGEGLPDITLTVGDSQSEALSAQFVQEQIRQNLGVEIGIETLESATFEDRFLSSDFQVTLGGWNADYADPENWLPSLWGTDQSNNISLYSNADFDAQMEQAAAELDDQARTDLYADGEAILIDEDAAFGSIYHNVKNWLVKPWVKGIMHTEADSETPGDWFFTSVTIEEH
jgi:oligopeptide transport system substrate-binding protein